MGVFGCIRYYQMENFERLHGNETGIKNVGIGRVMSLFSSSVVGVKLSWLFTVTLLSNRPWWWVWFGFYSIKGYFGILGFYLLGRFGFPDIRNLPAVNGEEDEGGSSLFTDVGSGRKRKYFFSSIWYCRQ